MDFLNAIILLLNYLFVPALAYGSQLALGSNFCFINLWNFKICLLYCWRPYVFWHNVYNFIYMVFSIFRNRFGFSSNSINCNTIWNFNYNFLCTSKDKLVFSYYRTKKSPPVMLAMVSIGTMFVTQAIVRIIIGPFDRRFFDGEKFIIRANEFKEMTGLNEGLAIKSTQVITLFVTIIVVSILFWFLNKTKTGKSMRAYSDNEDLALLSGIDPKKVVMTTWVIAAILATIGGALYGLDKSFKPFTYFNNMLPIFAAAIVGGIGNPFGAFLGGYVIAFSEILLTYAYKKFFVYLLPESLEPEGLLQLLSTDYKFAVSFSILVVVLLFRPSGIFKGKVL